MWTQDYVSVNKFATSKQDEVSYEKHKDVADELMSHHKDQLFENAYNIERYFEITLPTEDIDAMDDEILTGKVASQIMVLTNFKKTISG